MTYTSPHSRAWGDDLDFERPEAEQAEIDAEEERQGEAVDWVRLLAEYDGGNAEGEESDGNKS